MLSGLLAFCGAASGICRVCLEYLTLEMLAYGRQKAAYSHFVARIFRKILAEHLTHFIRKLLWLFSGAGRLLLARLGPTAADCARLWPVVAGHAFAHGACDGRVGEDCRNFCLYYYAPCENSAISRLCTDKRIVNGYVLSEISYVHVFKNTETKLRIVSSICTQVLPKILFDWKSSVEADCQLPGC